MSRHRLGHRLKRPGFESRQAKEIFPLLQNAQIGPWGSASFIFSGYRLYFPWLQHECSYNSTLLNTFTFSETGTCFCQRSWKAQRHTKAHIGIRVPIVQQNNLTLTSRSSRYIRNTPSNTNTVINNHIVKKVHTFFYSGSRISRTARRYVIDSYTYHHHHHPTWVRP